MICVSVIWSIRNKKHILKGKIMRCRICKSSDINLNDGYIDGSTLAVLIARHLGSCESFSELTHAYAGLSSVLEDELSRCINELVEEIKER
jgi:predicted LPLAT superfamily acyltransferase